MRANEAYVLNGVTVGTSLTVVYQGDGGYESYSVSVENVGGSQVTDAEFRYLAADNVTWTEVESTAFPAALVTNPGSTNTYQIRGQKANRVIRILLNSAGGTRVNLSITPADEVRVPEIEADVISEKTSGAGVTIDGLLIKDGAVSGEAALAAVVEDAINNGQTAKAPSQNAVFDALALKAPLASPVFTGTPETPSFSFPSSGMNPPTDNSKDIGNLAVNPRDIHASRAFVKKGVASTEGYGQLALKSISASKAFAGGGTEVIPVQVPSGAKIVGCQLRNDTILTATTGVSYSAAYSTGSTQAIGSGIDFAKNVKTDKFFDVNAATDITTGLTDITLTPNAGTLDTGTVTAVVYYYELTTMSSAA